MSQVKPAKGDVRLNGRVIWRSRLLGPAVTPSVFEAAKLNHEAMLERRRDRLAREEEQRIVDKHLREFRQKRRLERKLERGSVFAVGMTNG